MKWKDGRTCRISDALCFWLSEDGEFIVDTPGAGGEMNRKEVKKLKRFIKDALNDKLVHPDKKNVRLL